MNKLFKSSLIGLLVAFALSTSGCKDDAGYTDVDGLAPVMTLATEHIESGAGHQFTIEGNLEDKDGIATVRLKCPDLQLDKTIDLIDIYGEPKPSYALKYAFNLKKNEIGETFVIKVTVADVGGRVTEKDVLITMDGDFALPTFTAAPDHEVTVLLKAETTYKLSFAVTDDRALDYVLVNIAGVEGMTNRKIDAGGKSVFTFAEKFTLPGVVKNYDVNIKAVDKKGNETMTTSVIKVSEMPDFPKMYLSDVTTPEELNNDIFGVPMLINHTGPYKYTARYYNQKAGTQIFFLPQKTDFAPICFGLDPDNNNRLTDDPESAKPIVLDKVGVYYEIMLDVKASTYSMRTYSVTEATDPIPYKYGLGSASFDRWENGEQMIDFYLGWGGSPQDAGNHKFVQDVNNPHLFYYPAEGDSWILEAGQEMNFIVTNYHPDGWWDHVEWRVDNSTDIEKFGYFSKKNDVNPKWKGENRRWTDGTAVNDNWAKPTVKVGGNYRFIFDSHLGRGKIVPAQ